ncbi:MAG: helix-turn-helix transcriptional regulator [Deltaproteobacteria bacterium]|nr:helix-turn-helix transcriptional regulator [Deltaproteobacteria bacterium]
MSTTLRSACPIASALDLLGDRWTLVVLRDVLLARKRSFSELAAPEGIASNILSDRLNRLVDAGIVTREPDPDDGRRRIVLPTARGLELVPILLDLHLWGTRHTAGTAKPQLAEWVARDREAAIASFLP